MTESEATAASKAERAEGVKRMLNDEDPPAATPTNDPDRPEPAAGTDDAGESVTTGGEKIAARDGKEAGRSDTGGDGTPADRPTGTSTPRDTSGI